MTSTYFVPSVDTAARVLALLSRYSSRSMTLSEISVALEVSKATCLRVLKTLATHGLLQFEKSGKRYSLGYFCVVLGARAEEGLDYLSYVRPLLTEAAERTQLTTAFVQRVSEDRMMYVAKEEGRHAAGISVSIGNRFPVTEVSYGKWVMAFADDAERERILANGLRPVTSNTVTDIDIYLESVTAAKKSGILISVSEYIPGVTAVSCPVLDAQSELVGVVTVLGMSDLMQGKRLDSVLAVMHEIAGKSIFDGRGNRRLAPRREPTEST